MPTLYGPDGRPVNTKDLTRQVAVVSVRDRWSGYPSQGLTPQKLARIFKEADAGDVSRQAELFEEIEEKDCHLASILQTRKLAVLGLEYEILAYSDDPADQKVAEFVREVLDNDDFEDAMLDLLDAIGKGFAVSEILWNIQGGQAVISELKHVPQKKFVWEGDEIRLLMEQSGFKGEPLMPNKFAVHRYKARSGHPSRAGVLRVCSWMYLFKNYSVKDWVAFAEVYGMPLRLGKYDAGASPEDREALRQAVMQLGTDAAGIISKATEIEFVETAQRGGDIYEALADFADRQMSKAVLGQTLTTEVGGKGSYAASQTHQEVRQDLLEADCKALARTIHRQLIRPLVAFNFGPEAAAHLPWLKFHYEEPEDQVRSAGTYRTLIRDIGLPVAQEHVYDKFGVPKPEEGQDLVVPPTAGQGAGAPVEPAPASRQVIPLACPGCGAVAATAGGGLTPQQRAIEGLAGQALAEAGAAVGGLTAPVLQMIREAASLEDLAERISEAYAGMDRDALADLLARSLFVADLYGRWQAQGGGGRG